MASTSTFQNHERVTHIPDAAWNRPIGLPHENPGHPHAYDAATRDFGVYQGVPLGGLGAGSIGRTFRGDFARWHLDIGTQHYKPLPACMFSVYTRQGKNIKAQALWTDKPDDGSLNSWNWNYPVGAGTYYGLYPRSWFVYTDFPVELSVEQFSPIIRENYKESSYPVALFNWTAHNPTSESVTIGIMFSWQNLIGDDFVHPVPAGQIHELQELSTDEGILRGIVMRHQAIESQSKYGGTMAIAALEVPGTHVSYHTAFNAKGNGEKVWLPFSQRGQLSNDVVATGENAGAAVCITFDLAPGQTIEVPFVLAWDMPIMQFELGTAWYKRYTAFYGTSGNSAWKIAIDAIENRKQWQQQITDWQKPILDDPERPIWYKTALFNELYFLTDGATAWEHGRVDEVSPLSDYIGRFLYIECFDYPHYATFDVDYYASFALLELFPELEKGLMRHYGDVVVSEDLRDHPITTSGKIAPRKLAGAVPHDLGGPDEDPWLQPNNYRYRDVNDWKDLNPKFVLRLYRDIVLLNDETLARDYFKAAQMAMDYMQKFDYDSDGIPENGGYPDQTYDNWSAKGVSAYSGGLWLAALTSMNALAQQLGETEIASKYKLQLEQALDVYQSTLWNGDYYDYDASDNSIMSDQLAGQWYLDLIGLPLLPDENVISVLKTIYLYNVQGFGDGKMGAVNGMRPDGQVDKSHIQSQEMWTGVAYALASLMLARGMDDKAWATAYGVYRLTYEITGLWFRTPEAFDSEGNYRASLYQRALTIWAMETALKHRRVH